MPEAQRGIRYRDDWLILCNPVPLFQPHFTIVFCEHQPQRVGPAVHTMLDLSRDLDGAYTVFYNGPASGASAPDHLHLQATPAGTMPFETELAVQLCAGDRLGTARWIQWAVDGPVRIGTTRPSHRPTIVMLSKSKEALAASLQQVVGILGQVHPAEPEPMLNLFATYAEDRWIAWLFPRAAHRPRFYGTGPENYLISPGSVDLCGLIIVPRQADFDRLDPHTIQSIFHEVLLSPGAFAGLCELLTRETPTGKTGT